MLLTWIYFFSSAGHSITTIQFIQFTNKILAAARMLMGNSIGSSALKNLQNSIGLDLFDWQRAVVHTTATMGIPWTPYWCAAHWCPCVTMGPPDRKRIRRADPIKERSKATAAQLARFRSLIIMSIQWRPIDWSQLTCTSQSWRQLPFALAFRARLAFAQTNRIYISQHHLDHSSKVQFKNVFVYKLTWLYFVVFVVSIELVQLGSSLFVCFWSNGILGSFCKRW